MTKAIVALMLLLQSPWSKLSEVAAFQKTLPPGIRLTHDYCAFDPCGAAVLSKDCRLCVDQEMYIRVRAGSTSVELATLRKLLDKNAWDQTKVLFAGERVEPTHEVDYDTGLITVTLWTDRSTADCNRWDENTQAHQLSKLICFQAKAEYCKQYSCH